MERGTRSSVHALRVKNRVKQRKIVKLQFLKHLLAIQKQQFLVFSYFSKGVQACMLQMLPHLTKTPRLTSILSGQAWIDELINSPNEIVFYQNLGMHKPVFFELQSVLSDAGILSDSCWITQTEKLALLLYTLVTGLSNRQLQNRFQRSADTISKSVFFFELSCCSF
jgi:hypothetical protein